MDTLAYIWTDYDEDGDIFYVRLRPEVQDARTQEADHGVLIDRDPASGEVVGIEILDFLGHFAVLTDLSWLSSLGILSEIIPFLHQKAHELQQSASTGGMNSSS
jgi:uncharacterized protein YuzE